MPPSFISLSALSVLLFTASQVTLHFSILFYISLIVLSLFTSHFIFYLQFHKFLILFNFIEIIKHMVLKLISFAVENFFHKYVPLSPQEFCLITYLKLLKFCRPYFHPWIWESIIGSGICFLNRFGFFFFLHHLTLTNFSKNLIWGKKLVLKAKVSLYYCPIN